MFCLLKKNIEDSANLVYKEDFSLSFLLKVFVGLFPKKEFDTLLFSDFYHKKRSLTHEQDIKKFPIFEIRALLLEREVTGKWPV